MIHAIRPSSCMSFPFFFEKQNGDLVWGLSAMKGICPGLGKGEEVDQSFLFQTGSMVLEDLEIFREFVEEWNENIEEPTVLEFIEQILTDVRFKS